VRFIAEKTVAAAAAAAAAVYFFHRVSAVEPGRNAVPIIWAAATVALVVLAWVIQRGGALFSGRPEPEAERATPVPTSGTGIHAPGGALSSPFRIHLTILSAVLVLLPVFLLYLPTLNGSFLGDDWLILMLIKHTGAGSFREALSNYFETRHLWHSNLRFTNHLAWWVNYKLGGHDPVGYHLLNLAVHLANCCLIALVAGRLTGNRGAGFWAAVFFGLHPLMAEPVSWLYGRSDLLYTFFFLAAVFLLLRYRAVKKIRTNLALLVALAQAYISKEFSLVLVPFLIFTDLILFLPPGKREKFSSLLLRWIPLIFLVATYLVARRLLIPATGKVLGDRFSVLVGDMVSRGDLFRRFACDIPAYILFPVHGGDIASGLPVIAGGLLLGLISVSLAFRNWKAGEMRRVVIGAAWVVMALMPGLERLVYDSELQEARYLYSALPGAALIFGLSITGGTVRTEGRKRNFPLPYIRPAVAGLLLVLYLPLTASGISRWDRAMNAEAEFLGQAEQLLPVEWLGDRPDKVPDADLRIITYPRIEEWWLEEGIHVAGYTWTRAPLNLYYRYYMTFPVDIFRVEGSSGWRDPFYPDVYKWFNPRLEDYQAPVPLDGGGITEENDDILLLWRWDTRELLDIKRALREKIVRSESNQNVPETVGTEEESSIHVKPSAWTEFLLRRNDNNAVGRIFDGDQGSPPEGEAWKSSDAWPSDGVRLRIDYARKQQACAFSFPPGSAQSVRSIVFSIRLSEESIPSGHPVAGKLELRTDWGPWSLHTPFHFIPSPSGTTIVELPLENHVPLQLSGTLSDMVVYFTPTNGDTQTALFVEEVSLRRIPDRGNI